MTTSERSAAPAQPGPVTVPRSYRQGSLLAGWLSSTGLKVNGHRYLITSFGFSWWPARWP